jgi:hypothetical protein
MATVADQLVETHAAAGVERARSESGRRAAARDRYSRKRRARAGRHRRRCPPLDGLEVHLRTARRQRAARSQNEPQQLQSRSAPHWSADSVRFRHTPIRVLRPQVSRSLERGRRSRDTAGKMWSINTAQDRDSDPGALCPPQEKRYGTGTIGLQLFGSPDI